MPLNAINHPLIAHKIALLRQQGISTKQFRELANEVASLLTYEATRDLPLENREVNGWIIDKAFIISLYGITIDCG